jgi:uncharacterized membrane protein
MNDNDPRKLLVLAFDSPLKAQEAFLAVTRLMNEGSVLVQDAAFIQKRDDGKVKITETLDITPGEAAVRGSLWGALLGALVAGPIGLLAGAAINAGGYALIAKLTDIGIPDATVKEIGDTLDAGSTALALLVSHVDNDVLLAEMKRFAGARLVQTTLSPETVAALRSALEKT